MAYVILFVLALLAPLPPAAAEIVATEYEVKAAFLYNFVRFIDWPESAFQEVGDPFVIGVMGKDPFGFGIDTMLREKTVQNRPLILKRFTNAAEAIDCHILFIAKSEKARIEEILKTVEGKPVLTVSDVNRFARQGGMIGFTMENKKVCFSINKSAAEAAHLKFSSQILKLAKVVE